MSPTIRRRVIYHGRVQGVGFRAMTHAIASGFAVTGSVRNLSDGTVELIADGPVANVEAFLAAVEGEFSSHVSHTDVETLHGGEPPVGFTIRP